MNYVEHRDFTLRFELRCEFPDDYSGEEDGYQWAAGFRPIATEIVQAAVAALNRHPGWTVRPGNRGRPSEDEVTLVVERLARAGSSDP
jgi:hypothetical protein